jgi:hypothetical protein
MNVFRVVSSRKEKGEERVAVGGRGKYPGAPPHHLRKRDEKTSRPQGTVAAVENSDRKDLNTLCKFRNLISVNRIFIKDYKVSVSI